MAAKTDRQFCVFQTGSLRDLVNKVNQEDIQREDIVSTFQDHRTEEYILLYYK